MASERQDKALLRAQIDATDSAVQQFGTVLDSFLFKQLSKLLDPATKLKNPREVARVLGSLNGALDRAGLKEVLSRLNNIYGKQLEYVAKTFADVGKERVFSDIDVSVIESLIDYDVERVTARVGQYVADVKKTFQSSVLSGDVRPFAEIHDKFGESLKGSVETELNTALQGFNRTVTVSKSKELGFDLFRYLGPDDDVTRPFCEGVLQKDPAIYTLQEIEEMDNDQGLSVLVFGGGYNCRHQWRPISLEAAEALGYES